MRENFPLIQSNATEALKLVKHITRARKQAASSAKETRRPWAVRHKGLERTGKGREKSKKKNNNYTVNALFKLEGEVG